MKTTEKTYKLVLRVCPLQKFPAENFALAFQRKIDRLMRKD